MKIAASGLTDVGKKRSQNEDAFLINNDLNLCIVCDGMGGHSGGGLASQLAIQTIERTLQNFHQDPEATVISGVNSDEDNFGDQLRYALEVASSRIFDRAMYDVSLKGMGTTAVVSLFIEGRVFIANVGDSRAYFFHANKMKQMTTDHSLVSEQIEAGLITKSDARGHKLKNIITRSVGYQEEVEPDIQDFKVYMGDKILLCSDGLSNMVDDATIESIVVGHPIEEALSLLVKKANQNGGEDNITAVIAHVLDLE